MTPDDFVAAYERALASQEWENVRPFIAADACVTFSNGDVHAGREAIEAAFSRNFALIKNERYEMSNVRWLLKTPTVAVCLFDFAWAGLIDGESASGQGRGTTVLVCRDESWLLLTEHLGPRND